MSTADARTLQAAIAKVGKWLLNSVIVLAVVGCAFGWIYSGYFGLKSALVAIGVIAALFLVTWGIDKLIMKNIHLATSLVFGSYVVKLLIVVIVVIIARKTQMFEPVVMFVLLVTAIVIASLIQAYLLGRVQVIGTIDDGKTKEPDGKSRH